MHTGATISHYRIGDVLGEGGMGEVYRATDTRLGRAVAVKFLARRLTLDPIAKARFIREARAASALDHPNICTIHDVGETDHGDLYLVMALYEGDTLKRQLAGKPFGVERATRIGVQVARALKRAHAAGIIHRDIKPANIMVGPDDQVRLLDFGIAKLQADDSLTATGMTVGTAAYMSPEQATGESVRPATDVWSLGVVMFEMLTGQLPFKGDQPLAVVRSILHDEPELPEPLRHDLPPALAAALRRAMAKDVDARFPSAAEFLAALEGDRDAVGDRPFAAAGVARARGWRRGLVAAAMLAIFTSVAATVLWKRASNRTSPASVADRGDVVAVFPFTVRGASDLSYLTEGMVDLVSGRLDGAGAIRTVDPRAVVGRVSERDGETTEPRRDGELAASLGAGRYVTGQVVGLPGRLSISARIHSIDDDGEQHPLVTVEGEADSLFTLVDRLASGLLASTVSGANARIQRSAAVSAASLAATKAFLRGEQFHRRGQFDSASAGYNSAIALDSTFALAHLMKSMNNAYTYDTDDYMAAVKAERFSSQLPERDRGMIAAFLDQQAGRLTSAEQRWIAHLQRYPDEVKAHLQLGMLYNRANSRLGRDMEQSRPYFERVVALEPDNVPAIHHLARLDAAAGLVDSLAQRVRVLDRVAPGSEWAIDAGTMYVFSRHDSTEIQRFVDSFNDQSLLVRIYAMFNALRFSPDPGDVDRLLAVEQGGTGSRATGLPGQVHLASDLSMFMIAMSHLFHGRYDSVRAFVEAPVVRQTQSWLVWNAELVATGLVPADTAMLRRMVARLRRVDPIERLNTKFEPLHDIFTPAVAALEKEMALARLLARVGEFPAAWQIQRTIAALPQFPAWESLRDDAAASLAAELHYLQGDHERALELLRTLRFQVPQTANSLAITSGSQARFIRAELELERGDPEVARWFYQGFIDSFTPADKLFLPIAHERLGRIHESAGRTLEAIHHYRVFVRAWAGADQSLRSTRDAVEARLEGLRRRAG